MLSFAVKGCGAVLDCQWLSWAIVMYLLRAVEGPVVNCCGLLETSIAVSGCRGLSGAVKGCRKLSEADVSQKLFHGVLTQHPKNCMMLLDSF